MFDSLRRVQRAKGIVASGTVRKTLIRQGEGGENIVLVAKNVRNIRSTETILHSAETIAVSGDSPDEDGEPTKVNYQGVSYEDAKNYVVGFRELKMGLVPSNEEFDRMDAEAAAAAKAEDPAE